MGPSNYWFPSFYNVLIELISTQKAIIEKKFFGGQQM